MSPEQAPTSGLPNQLVPAAELTAFTWKWARLIAMVVLKEPLRLLTKVHLLSPE